MTTPLDQAHAAMTAAPENDALRLRFYERIAESEVFLLLDQDADGDSIAPSLFEIERDRFALAFDREERLVAFSEGEAAHATLSGRALFDMLSAADLGLGLNVDIAPSSFLMPPDGIKWLAQTLGHAPAEVEATPEEIVAPTGLPEVLISGLDAKLALAGGLAKFAYLCGVRYVGGAETHMLAFVDPVPGSEQALARAVNEALIFSGIEAGALDVAFFDASDPIAAKLARVGLRFDLPVVEDPIVRPTPGGNPDTPPRLR
ncbi:SseB family protein [Litoreibacter roseus]|uniref:SseB protein N-terminal domain-containing protein n=1 Tax=Litoreibacter roseus TaxID=2601869 RepID=A0A6N6JGV5_9RHOB|nr:SseB family protein [Litoreibacter roseus]GFE65070.1 hypothetical protein KIN_21440 [Litoreibacter roseus]